MLKLKLDNFKNSLGEYDFTNKQIDIIISELIEGIEIEVSDLNKVDIVMNSASIKLTGNILRTDKFICDISGLDSSKILSVKLPVLDYSVNEIFTMEVKYFPFDLNLSSQ